MSAVVVRDRQAMHRLGERLAPLLRAGDVVVLTGALGAGKTTLAQGIGAGLRVRGPITSPTFVIARVHPSLVGGPALVHVDAYRLSSLEEVAALDLEVTLESSVTVVEWGEGAVDALSDDRLLVTLDRPTGAAPTDDPAIVEDLDEPRAVTFDAVGTRWTRAELDSIAAGA